jgi:hypothetical protein
VVNFKLKGLALDTTTMDLKSKQVNNYVTKKLLITR